MNLDKHIPALSYVTRLDVTEEAVVVVVPSDFWGNHAEMGFSTLNEIRGYLFLVTSLPCVDVMFQSESHFG
jgi:hypothetical protein